MSDKKYTITSKEEKGNEVTLTVEAPHEIVAAKRQVAINDFKKNLEVKGFRKGSAPDNIVVEHTGELAILEKAAYHVLHELYPVILEEEKVEPLTQPQVSITKIAAGQPLEFKIIITTMPTVELPDYKAIAKKHGAVEKVEVTDKELDDYITYIQESVAKQSTQTEVAKKDDEKSDDSDDSDDTKKEGADKKDASDAKPKLPELTDEFVKTIGDFENVEDFKNKIRENMQKEKETKANQARRLKIMEEVIAGTKVDVPEVLVETEIDRMFGQFKDNIAQMKMDPEEYMKQLNKTEDDFRKEWKEDAKKRATMNMILPKIASIEKLSAPADKVDHEVKHLLEHHKELDPDHAKSYVEHVLRNEAVFEFLENVK